MYEERRRSDDNNWQEIKDFIKEQTVFNNESREYRSADSVRQEFIAGEVKKTNGRVNIIEDKIKGYDAVINERRAAKLDRNNLIGIITGVVMAVSAVVILFKK